MASPRIYITSLSLHPETDVVHVNGRIELPKLESYLGKDRLTGRVRPILFRQSLEDLEEGGQAYIPSRNNPVKGWKTVPRNMKFAASQAITQALLAIEELMEDDFPETLDAREVPYRAAYEISYSSEDGSMVVTPIEDEEGVEVNLGDVL